MAQHRNDELSAHMKKLSESVDGILHYLEQPGSVGEETTKTDFEVSLLIAVAALGNTVSIIHRCSESQKSLEKKYEAEAEKVKQLESMLAESRNAGNPLRFSANQDGNRGDSEMGLPPPHQPQPSTSSFVPPISSSSTSFTPPGRFHEEGASNRIIPNDSEVPIVCVPIPPGPPAGMRSNGETGREHLDADISSDFGPPSTVLSVGTLRKIEEKELMIDPTFSPYGSRRTLRKTQERTLRSKRSKESAASPNQTKPKSKERKGKGKK